MCTHWWLIEPADGETSQGVCKYCGEVQEFTNYLNRFVPMAIAMHSKKVYDMDFDRMEESSKRGLQTIQDQRG